MSTDRPNPAADLEPDAPFFEGFRARKPIATKDGYHWNSHQVGIVVQETRQIRTGRHTTMPVVVDLFHLKGFGRSYDEALDMARKAVRS